VYLPFPSRNRGRRSRRRKTLTMLQKKKEIGVSPLAGSERKKVGKAKTRRAILGGRRRGRRARTVRTAQGKNIKDKRVGGWGLMEKETLCVGEDGAGFLPDEATKVWLGNSRKSRKKNFAQRGARSRRGTQWRDDQPRHAVRSQKEPKKRHERAVAQGVGEKDRPTASITAYQITARAPSSM